MTGLGSPNAFTPNICLIASFESTIGAIANSVAEKLDSGDDSQTQGHIIIEWTCQSLNKLSISV